jgi:TrmH family RNA methyltransferase
MLSKNLIKHLSALKLKKFREEYNEFVVEGHKLVIELVHSHFRIKGIYALGEWINLNRDEVDRFNIPLVEICASELERITTLSTPGQVLAHVEIPVNKTNQENIPVPGQSLILALDDIRDPGNLGTIIRIADWFGIREIFCSENCVEVYNPKVIQATMGSITRVAVHYINLALFLGQYRQSAGAEIYGAMLEGDSIYDSQLFKPGLLLIGNESRGINPDLIPLVTRKVRIPVYGDTTGGKAESLNASIATAIICAEFRRMETINAK